MPAPSPALRRMPPPVAASRRSRACKAKSADSAAGARTTEGIGRTMGEQFSVNFRKKAGGRAGARGTPAAYQTLAAKEHLTTSRAHASPQVLRYLARSMKPVTT